MLEHEDLDQQDLGHEDLAHEDFAHEDVAREDLAHQDLEHEDLAEIEQRLRDLTEHALEAARERAACETAADRARETLEAAHAELPVAERIAKERRQAQHDALRGRAELEHRFAELSEVEELTRARRLQAQQRAQGFRAAAAFAGAGRTEAEAGQEIERGQRERLVEERAAREAAAAEARASEELAEETKVGRHRAEIEKHLEAERALEAEIRSDRTGAEARVTTLRETIESASFELHEAQVNLERLNAERERLAKERALAGERLREVGARAREEIEARVRELRAKELEIALEREEQERLLAVLSQNEEPLEPEPQAAHSEDDAVAALVDEADEHVAAESASPEVAAEPPAPEPHFSTVTFTAHPPARDAAPASRAVPEAGYDHEDIGPDFRSLIGNIFTRRKAIEDPIEEAGPSIAERIARDFGNLGGSDDEPEESLVPHAAPVVSESERAAG
jgi:hypothetical protein